MTDRAERERRSRVYRAVANERGEETAQRVADAACGEAVMFRDEDYGALVVESVADGLALYDFGFSERDAQAVKQVLTRYAVAEQREDHVRWRTDRDAHSLAVLSTLQQEMRLRGYLSDKLAERAIIQVKPGEMRKPDLPMSGKVLVHEAVEAGIRQRLSLVAAALREGADVSAPSLRFYVRPNATNLGAVRPPFVVSRFFVSSKNKSESVLRETALAAVGDWRPHLVKLAVVAEAAGKYAVEVGLAIPATLCEAFLDNAVPTFQYSNIIGAREVEFDLATSLTEEERQDIEALGRSCTGCLRIMQEGTRLVVQVPSNIPGHYGADYALHERLSWLNRVLEPWHPSVCDIGPLAEVDLRPETRHEELHEDGEPLDEYKKMTAAQRTAMSKSRKLLARNAEHQRELLLRRKDWKKNKGAQKKASVWRKRTSAMRGESVAECDEDDNNGQDDAANMVNGDVVAVLASRFAKMPPQWWETPQGEDALRKAKALIKDEHGEDAAKRFDKQLELLRLTSSPTMKAEAKRLAPKEAFAKLKATKKLSTELLEPLGIGFESFLRLAQLSKADSDAIVQKLIKSLASKFGADESAATRQDTLRALLEVDASLGRTMLKAAGTFVPIAGAKMDGSDDEEEKGVTSDPPEGDDEDGPVDDEDGDGEENDADEEDETEAAEESVVLVTERVAPSALGQAIRVSAAKPRETRQGKGETALYFESERSANVFMSALTKSGFAYGTDFLYEKRPCGIEYVVSLPEGQQVREDYAAYLGEPGRGSKKSQYMLVGRGTNAKMVAARGRSNLHRMGPATLVTVEAGGDTPLPFRVDGTRTELARATGGKVVDSEDNRFGGVESVVEAAEVRRDFEITMFDRTKQVVKGGVVIGDVWGLEPSWYLHHLPTGMQVGEFATKENVLKAIELLIALPGVDWTSRNARELGRVAGRDVAAIVKQYGGEAKQTGAREVQVMDIKEFAKRFWKDISVRVEMDVARRLDAYQGALRVRERVSTPPLQVMQQYGRHVRFPTDAEKKEAEGILASKQEKEGTIGGVRLSPRYHTKPSVAGLAPGDDLGPLAKVLASLRKLTIKHTYVGPSASTAVSRKNPVTFSIKLVNFHWGTEDGAPTVVCDARYS